MNFRKFFYRDYFNGVNLDKPIDKREFDTIKDRNKNFLVAANKRLKDATVTPEQLVSLSHPFSRNRTPDRIILTTTYPGLLIGTGYAHETLNEKEFKLGFYFDYTTGLPCIPGSSIKGALRSVFPQFREKHPNRIPTKVSDIEQSKIEYIATLSGWKDDPGKTLKVHQFEMAVFEGIDLDRSGKDETVYNNVYNRFCFYNGYISKADRENKIFEIDTITPHTAGPLKNPTPLNFLKIRPGIEFTLQMQLQDVNYLGLKKDKIKTIFENILKTIGLGAKTNVGYGQFN